MPKSGAQAAHAAAQPLSASLEDYLEAIFHIVSRRQVARGKDVALRLGVNNSSVTGAFHALADRALINYAPYGLVTLTARGKRAARDIVRRHEVLREFFVRVLGVDDRDAEEAACRMEHAMPPSILERFIVFVSERDGEASARTSRSRRGAAPVREEDA